MNIDTLFVHGTVIPMDPERRIIEDGALAVHEGRILEAGRSADLLAKYRPAKTVDCKGKAVLPGFVDVHGHAGHALMKSVGMDAPSFWMGTVTPLYHHFTTDEFWRIEGRLAALERLRAGVTCGLSVISSAQRSDDPVFAVNNAEGYRDVGIRGIVAVGPSNPPYPRKFSRWKDGKRIEKEFGFDALMEGAEAAIDACQAMADERIRAFIAPFVLITSVFGSGATPPDVCSALSEQDRTMMRRVRDLAVRKKTRIHTEAFGGMVRLAARDENALLGPDVHLHHCRGISLDEALILARTGTHVSSSPGPQHGTSRCPLPELLSLGVNACVATDGTTPANSFDLIQAARLTQLTQRMLTQNRYVLPEGTLLEMITINAARAVGWDDEIGSLEPGKKADVVVFGLWKPHLAPNVMPVHKIMSKGVGGDIETVMVSGRFVMEDGRVLGVDEDEVLREGHEEALATIRRAGIEAALVPPKSFWGGAEMHFESKPEPRFNWDA